MFRKPTSHSSSSRTVLTTAVITSLTLVASLVAVPSGAAASAAVAPKPMARSPEPSYKLTFVARQCATYKDVMANRARNDIQESLQDLGQNTLYSGGQVVDPATEQRGDPKCDPLDGWQFTLGNSFTKNGVLTVVRGENGSAGPTGTTPELDQQGNTTGRTLKGAVTLTLTDQQRQLAGQGNLWVQGGTVADPLMTGKFGKGAFGFAALRCSQDDNNGDNVETIGFPSGTRHEFCYAYYVNPEPGNGSLTIRKQIEGGGGHERFTFASNATYNPGGTFDLAVDGGPAEETFNRATSAAFGGSYDFTERVPSGWRLKDVKCSATNPDGAASSTWQISGPTVKVTLADRDHVTCVYTDTPPRDPGLVLRKVTYGHDGGGPFTFFVKPDDSSPSSSLTATTAKEGTSVKATGDDLSSVPPGGYTIAEVSPSSPAGTWSLDKVLCDGKEQKLLPDNSIHLDLTVNTDADCTFVNRFVPRGYLRLRTVTEGGTGTGTFTAVRTTGPDLPQYIAQSATTQASGKPKLASGDSSGALRLEQYELTAYAPMADARGYWKLRSFTCGKATVQRIAANRLRITLSDRNPGADCTAVYYRVPAAEVRLVKVAKPSGVGTAVQEIRCANGARGRTVLTNGKRRATLPEPLSAVFPTRCRVSERFNDRAEKALLSSKAALTVDGRRKGIGLPGTFSTSDAHHRYEVKVTNTYRRKHHAPPVCRTADALALCRQAR